MANADSIKMVAPGKMEVSGNFKVILCAAHRSSLLSSSLMGQYSKCDMCFCLLWHSDSFINHLCNFGLCLLCHQSEDKSAISKAQASQRNQVIHDKTPGNQTRQNYHKFHMSHDEWQRLEKQTMARYRQSLVHKARPMPDYKFFVPKRNLKPLTTPISPNLPGKKIRNNYSTNS